MPGEQEMFLESRPSGWFPRVTLRASQQLSAASHCSTSTALQISCFFKMPFLVNPYPCNSQSLTVGIFVILWAHPASEREGPWCLFYRASP